MLEITLEHTQGRVPVTILAARGSLDAQNAQDFDARAREAYDGGARNLLVDLREVTFLSSAGLSGLHRAALLFGGERPAEGESRYEALQAVFDDERRHRHLKLLGPQPQVARIFTMTGLDVFFEIHADREQAVMSFQQE